MFVDDVKPLDTSPSRAAGLVADIYRLRWPKIRFAHELKKATKELPADSVQKFCDEVCYNLMLTGTQLNCPERHLLDLIVHMVESETISWITVVNTFAKFNDFEKPKCVAAICDVLRDCLLEISCDPRNDCECKQLSEAIERILEWFLHGAEESPKKSINSLRPIAECFQLYSENRFIHVVIHLRSQLDVELIHRWHSELNNFWVGLKGPFYDPDMVNECYKSILESINRLGEKPSIDLHSVTINYLRDARPTISTLLTVYSSFRMLKGISEICDACLMLGDLLGLTGPDLLNDITRTALLIAVQPDEFQERNGPVHVFVFQTVPLLMVELINRGRVTREEIIATLDYICDQRTLLDAVDAKSKYNFFQCFTDQICEQRVLGITIQDVQYILDRRLALIKREIIERRHENNPASTYQVFLAAKKAQKNLVKQDYTASIWMRSMPILIRSQFTFDSICAWCALDGNLDSLISKLLS
ncbi:hypothetical protein L596_018435 [Steinernema carpocapsae]|uniref:Mediator of RNA polymerase II transcription subunit 24 n=1 Tax=Steinernema carpocapsae TaxID=34508 RepID=A0A4U5N539_STECR|nr:hypothetical protein L596_018435 [Steinernema carpocapsae]